VQLNVNLTQYPTWFFLLY